MTDWVFHGVLPPFDVAEPPWVAVPRASDDPLGDAARWLREGTLTPDDMRPVLRGGDDLALVQAAAKRST